MRLPRPRSREQGIECAQLVFTTPRSAFSGNSAGEPISLSVDWFSGDCDIKNHLMMTSRARWSLASSQFLGSSTRLFFLLIYGVSLRLVMTKSKRE